IRNAFQTAIALAQYDRVAKLEKGNSSEAEAHTKKKTKTKLRKTHFEKVAQATKEFDDYLRETHAGRDDADQAQQDELRNDDYSAASRTPDRAVHEVAATSAPRLSATRSNVVVTPRNKPASTPRPEKPMPMKARQEPWFRSEHSSEDQDVGKGNSSDSESDSDDD
ncbi:hypothetical protein B0A49_13859, partial [Cryomyces minteri]